MGEMDDEKGYDKHELERLWKLSYSELALAPGEKGARLREARFIMQARAASETRQLGVIMTIATVAMTLATIVMAVMAYKG